MPLRTQPWRYAAAALPFLLIAALAKPALGANGATAVDDTDIDPVGVCKVDSWLSAASNADRIGLVSPGCVFNLGVPTDISAQFIRSRADGTWNNSAAIKFRTFRIPADGGRISVLFSAGATYDLSNGLVSSVAVNIPVTFQLVENMKLNVNGGWLYDRAAELHWATWGASVDWSVNDRISLIGEVFGQLGHRVEDQPSLSDPRMQFIFRLKPNENVDFDIAYGRNITGVPANWITVGLNLRFNAFGERAAAEAPRPTPRIRK